jgi:hypothetical protein
MPLKELLEQKACRIYRLARFYVVAHYIVNNKHLTIDVKKTMEAKVRHLRT